MSRKDAKIFQKNHVRLVKNLEAPHVLGYLYQEGVLSEDDKEVISAKKTSKKQNEKLLSKLKKRKDGLKMLIKALLISGVQAFLGSELLEIVTWSEEDMKTFELELEGTIDPHHMMEAKVATLKRENSQLKAKNQSTTKDLTDQNQMLVEEVTTLKRENSQLKAKNDENQSPAKDLTEQNQMLVEEVATLKRENSQLKAKNDENQSPTKDVTEQNQMLEADIPRLKERIKVLEMEIEALKQENQSLKPAKTSLQEDVTIENLEFRARGNAVSFKKGGRELHQNLRKLEMLKQKIEKIQGAYKSTLQENDGDETSISRQEYQHELRARRNAISYGEGGRAAYLADCKKRQTVRQS